MSQQAATTRDLRNYKGHFRAATQTILREGGAVPAELERGLAKLKCTVRTEINFDLGAATNLETLPSGKKVYDFFMAKLRIRVVTGRRQMQPFPEDLARDLHEYFSSVVLDLFGEEKEPFTEALLPYYAVKILVPTGSRSDLDVIYFEDFTDLNYDLQFGVRSKAWPAAYLLAA